MDQRAPLGRILAGWIAILLCSLLLYDALLYSSLRTATREGTQASASVAATALKSRMAIGIRFGKKLETYHNIDRLLASVGQAADMPLAVLDARGMALHHWGRFPLLPDISDRLPKTGTEAVLSLKDGELLLAPSRTGTSTSWAISRSGCLPAIWMPHSGTFSGSSCSFRAGWHWQGYCFCPSASACAVPVVCPAICASPFSCCSCWAMGALALHAVSRQYTQGLRNDAAHTGAILTEDLNRLLLVGVSLDDTSRLSAYLTRAATAHGDDLVLEVLAPSGKVFASSHASGPLPELLPPGEEFPLLELASAFSVSGDSPEQGWKLRATLTCGPWLERLIANGLDILTLVAISLIFMVEMFLLLSRSLEARLQGTTQSHAHRSALFRPLMFVFILAMDMTISFIPLRMAELTTTSILPRDVLLGLPISAEMGMTGLSVLIAGTWMKRKGARPPLMTGIICMALGYLASMLAWTPWLFIAARALVGLGYGLSLLTAQAYTVRDGKLADMFAGVYAGSLCGSALGAMLAERLGYGPVFAISAVILACLALVPLRLLRGQEKQEDVREEAPAARLTLPQIRRLLADRHFLAFILLALLPSALLCVGFLNYFLPVFLKQADVAQSNIGRIYMLNCLIVIYSGPLFARLVGNSLHKGPLLFWAGILSALSVACFCFLPPLPASVAGSILLGLATGLNIPAQSEFLLELDIARAIGVDQAMSLLDALQRVGQVIGPVCVGAVMAIMSVDDAARWAGIILVAISLLFLLLVRPARHSGDRA